MSNPQQQNAPDFNPTYESDGDGNQVLKGTTNPVTGEMEHRQVGVQDSPYGDDVEPGRCPDSGMQDEANIRLIAAKEIIQMDQKALTTGH